MKFLIKNNNALTKENVMFYFENSLKQTNLIKKDIKVSKKVKTLIGLKRIEIILNENSINKNVIEIDYKNSLFLFHDSGNNIIISKKEIKIRFNDVFDGTLEYLKTRE